MKDLPVLLRKAQSDTNISPAIMFDIGDISIRFPGGTSTCYNTDVIDRQWDRDPHSRIIGIPEYEEQPYTQKLRLTVSNYDGLFSERNFSGDRVKLYWGCITKQGPMYIPRPPMRVFKQQRTSMQGYLLAEFTCYGIADQLNQDGAKSKWLAPNDYTLQALLNKVLGNGVDLLDCYADCKKYRIIYGDEHGSTLDGLIDTVMPGQSFVIAKNESRLNVIQRLLEMTYCVFRPGVEDPTTAGYDTVHIFNPLRSGPHYDYEYSLAKGTHKFYVMSDVIGLTIPNVVYVKTPDGVSPSYSGVAKDMSTINRMDGDEKPHTEYLEGLTSEDQASAVASAILSNIMSQTKGASVKIPMDCGRECHDYISCDGQLRDPKSAVLNGNVGTLNVVFDPMRKKYDMTFTFGGWLTPKKLQELIPNIYTGAVTEDGSVLQASETPKTLNLPTTELAIDGEITIRRFTVPTGKTVNVYHAGISFEDGTTDTNLMILLYDNTDIIELDRWVESWEEGTPLYAGGDLAGHDLSIIVRNSTGYQKYASASIHIEVVDE